MQKQLSNNIVEWFSTVWLLQSKPINSNDAELALFFFQKSGVDVNPLTSFSKFFLVAKLGKQQQQDETLQHLAWVQTASEIDVKFIPIHIYLRCRTATLFNNFFLINLSSTKTQVLLTKALSLL